LNESDWLRRIPALWRFAKLCLLHPQLRRQPFYLGARASVRIERGAHIYIGQRVRILPDFTLHVRGILVVGDDVFFNRGCHVVAQECVVIGAGCLFGESVSIHDENHLLPARDRRRAGDALSTAPILLGRQVWVGAKATITAGVTIGTGAVIGANAVVTHDIAPHWLAAGVPAHLIRAL
jgi:acetyltransferase-like isoleucine patch superfamily enzyme